MIKEVNALLELVD